MESDINRRHEYDIVKLSQETHFTFYDSLSGLFSPFRPLPGAVPAIPFGRQSENIIIFFSTIQTQSAHREDCKAV